MPPHQGEARPPVVTASDVHAAMIEVMEKLLERMKAHLQWCVPFAVIGQEQCADCTDLGESSKS